MVSFFACNEGGIRNLPDSPTPFPDSDVDTDSDVDSDTDTDADTDTDTDVDTDVDADTDSDSDADADADADPLPAPEIEVDPIAIEFGYVEDGLSVQETFAVSNLGDTDLHITGISFGGSPRFAMFGSTSFTLPPSQSVSLSVTYLSNGGDNTGVITILSDDDDESSVDVTVASSSVVPDLIIDPPVIDFGALDRTCFDTQAVTLQNVGGVPVTVNSIALNDTGGSTVLTGLPSLPMTLQPAQTYTFDARYTANLLGAYTATIDVDSTDPDGIETATLIGSANIRSGYDSSVTPAAPPVDIIFAVDQSGSMDANAAGLAGALGDFVTGLAGVNADWRIGVVTFDDGCFNNSFDGGAIWFDANTPGYTSDFANAATLGDNDNPNNDNTEELFTVVGRSLANTAPGSCNAGFLRPGSLLHVIFVSDEEEQSTGAPYNIVLESSAPTPGASTQGNYQSYLSDPSMLKSSTVANLSHCGNNPNFILSGYRYEALANGTGGLALDICAGDWGNQMASLGDTSQNTSTVFLSNAPEPTSITVTVDGSPTTDFTYAPGPNSVTLNTPAAAGSLIEATYEMLPICLP